MREQNAKAWCFDHGVTDEQATRAWNYALSHGNPIMKNLAAHGHTWRFLPTHLLAQLVERYSERKGGDGVG